MFDLEAHDANPAIFTVACWVMNNYCQGGSRGRYGSIFREWVDTYIWFPSSRSQNLTGPMDPESNEGRQTNEASGEIQLRALLYSNLIRRNRDAQ